jgi:hypothetical protein
MLWEKRVKIKGILGNSENHLLTESPERGLEKSVFEEQIRRRLKMP